LSCTWSWLVQSASLYCNKNSHTSLINISLLSINSYKATAQNWESKRSEIHLSNTYNISYHLILVIVHLFANPGSLIASNWNKRRVIMYTHYLKVTPSTAAHGHAWCLRPINPELWLKKRNEALQHVEVNWRFLNFKHQENINV